MGTVDPPCVHRGVWCTVDDGVVRESCGGRCCGRGDCSCVLLQRCFHYIIDRAVIHHPRCSLIVQGYWEYWFLVGCVCLLAQLRACPPRRTCPISPLFVVFIRILCLFHGFLSIWQRSCCFVFLKSCVCVSSPVPRAKLDGTFFDPFIAGSVWLFRLVDDSLDRPRVGGHSVGTHFCCRCSSSRWR